MAACQSEPGRASRQKRTRAGTSAPRRPGRRPRPPPPPPPPPQTAATAPPTPSLIHAPTANNRRRRHICMEMHVADKSLAPTKEDRERLSECGRAARAHETCRAGDRGSTGRSRRRADRAQHVCRLSVRRRPQVCPPEPPLEPTQPAAVALPRAWLVRSPPGPLDSVSNYYYTTQHRSGCPTDLYPAHLDPASLYNHTIQHPPDRNGFHPAHPGKPARPLLTHGTEGRQLPFVLMPHT